MTCSAFNTWQTKTENNLSSLYISFSDTPSSPGDNKPILHINHSLGTPPPNLQSVPPPICAFLIHMLFNFEKLNTSTTFLCLSVRLDKLL